MRIRNIVAFMAAMSIMLSCTLSASASAVWSTDTCGISLTRIKRSMPQ
ncbi:MAG: hypothetical protein IKO30_11020 [Lachnospiraceae bacterium]|nr:hypothetical protein [Lachnospiraceae bacterium]